VIIAKVDEIDENPNQTTITRNGGTWDADGLHFESTGGVTIDIPLLNKYGGAYPQIMVLSSQRISGQIDHDEVLIIYEEIV
jgi:hypothetical protein